MVSSTTLDPHGIMQQADMREYIASNAAGPRVLYEHMYFFARKSWVHTAHESTGRYGQDTALRRYLVLH